jgi:predicted NBD/HSP70 family sugar kinase
MQKQRSEAITDRERKNLNILETLRRHSPMTKADISKYTDLNIVTISNYINNFINKKLVLEEGLEDSSGGRRPELISLNENTAYVGGLDLGAQYRSGASEIKMRGTILNARGDSLIKLEKSRPEENLTDTLEHAENFIEELIKKSSSPKEGLRGFGIGVPGIVDAISGTVRYTQAGSRQEFLKLKTEIEKKFSFPLVIENDTTVAAFGEKMLMLEEDVRNMIYMYSDVGCGIIIKGEIYYGTSGSAGEVGIHHPSKDDYVNMLHDSAYMRSGNYDLGITRQAREILKNNAKSKIIDLADGNPENITPDIIFKAARMDDRLAQELLENAAIHLGIKLSYLINLFNPEVVVIGGGMEKADNLFFEPLIKSVRRWSHEESSQQVKIVPARLGKYAVAIGAACVMLQDIFARA